MSATVVVAESRVRAHHERMRVVGGAMFASAIVLGVTGLGVQLVIAIAGAAEVDTIASVRAGAVALGLGELSAPGMILLGALTTWASVAAIVGAIVGIPALRRASRELAIPGDLAITLEGRALTEIRRERTVRSREPILAAQAFADHVQIVVGTVPRLDQVEVPLDGAERSRVIALLREQGIAVGERPAYTTHVLRALVLVPPVMIAAMIAFRLLLLLAAWLVGAPV